MASPEVGIRRGRDQPINYALSACDHEWERRHLWTEGITARPSDTIREQVYVTFWYEAAGTDLRHEVGLDNIMWESDYPHIASTYPRSWEFVRRSLANVPSSEHPKLLYENVARLYHLDLRLPASPDQTQIPALATPGDAAR